MTLQKIKTSGKVFEALQKTLKKDNAKFKKLTRAKQRVAIAQDVIAQVRAKKFVADSTYFDWGAQGTEVLCNTLEEAEEAELDASECISQVKCSVCGIGSLFLSGIRKNDKLSINKFLNHDWEMRDMAVEYLGKWFDSNQLDLVEDFYERNGDQCDTDGWTHEESSSPIYREDNNNKRLVMIMENIISNSGRFNPKKGEHKIDRDPCNSDSYYSGEVDE
jgi:hypothetical protein